MNENQISNIQIIEKEDIPNLKFPSEHISSSEEEKQTLQQQLQRATTLVNLSKHKVSIVFSDSEGVKKVITTIWAITEKMVILKKSTSIPIHRIHSVELL